jgi:hypothetical protein
MTAATRNGAPAASPREAAARDWLARLLGPEAERASGTASTVPPGTVEAKDATAHQRAVAPKGGKPPFGG